MSTTRSTATSTFEEVKVTPLFLVCLSLTHASLYTAWGFAYQFMFGLPWWFVLLTMYTMYILSIGTHLIGHMKWAGWWYRAHMGHHIADYPPSKFLSEGYTNAKQDNAVAYYPSMFICPLLVNAMLGSWTWTSTLCAFVPGAVMLYVANVFHMAFHTNHHAWERYAWFHKLRTLHYYHHKGTMKHNYAIGDFMVDFAWGTLRMSW